MDAPDTINAVAAAHDEYDIRGVISTTVLARLESIDGTTHHNAAVHALRGIGGHVYRALASAGWLRTAEDRAVLDAADRHEQMWAGGTAKDAELHRTVRARRVAAGGTEAQL